MAQRSKSAVIPKVSETKLSGKTYFLKGGKLYGPRRLPNGRGNNTVDFTQTDRNGQTYIEPNPSGGIVVDPKGNNVSQIKGKFSGIPPSSFFIRIYVWPDSFEHFEAVREAIQDLGLKTLLEPGEDNLEIVIGGGSSGPAYVQ